MTRLYDATSRIVYGLALRIVREPSVAEEITLEVFLQVWRTAGTYDLMRGTVAAWLTTLARTRSIDWLRSRQARIARQTQALNEAQNTVDVAADPEHAWEDSDRSRTLRLSMQALPVEQRQSIELAYFLGFTQSEIAARLGLPLGTVKARIRLGMSRLRQSLSPYREEGP